MEYLISTIIDELINNQMELIDDIKNVFEYTKSSNCNILIYDEYKQSIEIKRKILCVSVSPKPSNRFKYYKIPLDYLSLEKIISVIWSILINDYACKNNSNQIVKISNCIKDCIRIYISDGNISIKPIKIYISDNIHQDSLRIIFSPNIQIQNAELFFAEKIANSNYFQILYEL